jgi:NAD(P)H-dependent flavin oxidoreductase YrpB (nitropropane dioxygenase family)
VFALCSDSGLDPEIRARLLEGIARDELVVHTDPVASPTGFPFKVVDVSGTMSDAVSYESRERLCDLGYLRTPFAKADGSIGFRCAGEPVHMYVRKGGMEDETVGRKCLCNGLAAAVGMGQQRRTGYQELPIVTLGSDLQGPRRMIARHPGGWTAAEAIEWMLSQPLLAKAAALEGPPSAP